MVFDCLLLVRGKSRINQSENYGSRTKSHNKLNSGVLKSNLGWMSARVDILHYLYLNYFLHNVCWPILLLPKLEGFWNNRNYYENNFTDSSKPLGVRHLWKRRRSIISRVSNIVFPILIYCLKFYQIYYFILFFVVYFILFFLFCFINSRPSYITWLQLLKCYPSSYFFSYTR